MKPNPLPNYIFSMLVTSTLAWLGFAHSLQADASTVDTPPGFETPQMKRGTQFRGFTMSSNGFPEKLKDAVEQWNMNIVRYWMPKGDQWQGHLKVLPRHLDAARDLGVRMVIVGEVPPHPKAKSQGETQRDRQHDYWNDELNLDALVDGWRKIAEVCKDRPEEIWYDLFNEPLDWEDFPSYPKNWPRWAQRIVDEIRTIDKKNPILISTGPGGLEWGMKDFPILKGKPLIYQIHQYVPHEYTHQGISDIRNTDLARTYLERQRGWPGKFADGNISGYWDHNMLEYAIRATLDFQRRNPDIPIFVGEFSAVRWAPGADRYLEDCIKIFEKYGWDWTYHGFRDDPVWSLEHENNFSTSDDAKLAKNMTDRGMVMKKYLNKNKKQKRN